MPSAIGWDMINLTLYALTGTFAIVRILEVSNETEARKVVESHLLDSGYTELRTIDGEDGSLRFVADPPKGRKGRNVASLDI
jgi:hypothetical protein